MQSRVGSFFGKLFDTLHDSVKQIVDVHVACSSLWVLPLLTGEKEKVSGGG
ncbi:MAG TPA: hypothetical protein PLJ05_07575 [Caldisericia bacterium]|jgi:hypothetical protein|nr:hypothetical protein [Caldisericia bacterium]